jgi:hypothetical protein
MTTFKIRAYRILGDDEAAEHAVRLVYRSQWFECTPLPDDEYEFVVKDEAGSTEHRPYDRRTRAVDEQ